MSLFNALSVSKSAHIDLALTPPLDALLPRSFLQTGTQATEVIVALHFRRLRSSSTRPSRARPVPPQHRSSGHYQSVVNQVLCPVSQLRVLEEDQEVKVGVRREVSVPHRVLVLVGQEM